MLHTNFKTLTPKSKTMPLGLFATFNPANSSAPDEKTERISKQPIQPMANNQTIADSLTFIPSPGPGDDQQEPTTQKNINGKRGKVNYNSSKIDENQSWANKKEQTYEDHTKISERQPQLVQLLSSLRIKDSIGSRQFPNKKIYNDSLVRIQYREQHDEMENSEQIMDDNEEYLRKGLLSLNQTVSIIFIPKQNSRKAPFLSQKVDKKVVENDYDCSLISRKSSFTPKSQSQQLPLPKSNLIHLTQIRLLLQKNELKNKRIKEFLQSNEKMRHRYRTNKDHLDLYLAEMAKMKENVIALQRELIMQKQKIDLLLIEKQQRERTLHSLKALNEQYLKDNNDIKQKLKGYLKIIHELKLQLSEKELKQQTTNFRGSHSTLNLILDAKHQLNALYNDNNNLPAQPMTTKNGRSYIDISHQIPKQKNSQKAFGKVNVEEKSRKINNSYSIPHFHDMKNMQKQMKDEEEGFQNIYSHRNVTLTPNFFTQMTEEDDYEPKFGSGVNTIFSKNPPRRNTLKLHERQKSVDKSLSGFSNLSGISACQKIGYIVKPRKQENIGELVDYLEAEHLNQQRTFRARNWTAFDINRKQQRIQK